jgi:hypothetical protein
MERSAPLTGCVITWNTICATRNKSAAHQRTGPDLIRGSTVSTGWSLLSCFEILSGEGEGVTLREIEVVGLGAFLFLVNFLPIPADSVVTSQRARIVVARASNFSFFVPLFLSAPPVQECMRRWCNPPFALEGPQVGRHKPSALPSASALFQSEDSHHLSR